MICIVCKRPIERSYGAPGLIGCYCQYCATAMKLTPEQILKSQYEQAIKELTEEIERLKACNERQATTIKAYHIGDLTNNVISKMQERLKAEVFTLVDYNEELCDVILSNTIDQVAEELRKEIGEGR